MSENVGVGVDFGTTNSVVATFDGESLQHVVLENESPVMPSATYVSRRLQFTVGQKAIDQFIADNVGRRVELIPEVIGQHSTIVGGSGIEEVDTVSQNVYSEPRLDLGLEGRLFRGLKRLLARRDLERLAVFEQKFRIVALVTPLLTRMREALVSFGVTHARCCAGHPIVFEGATDGQPAIALDRFGEALRYAKLLKHRFFPEPIAATLSYLHTHRQHRCRYILTLDFGGGTLDLCVLARRTDGSFEVVGTRGIGLGGDHIDQRLFESFLFKLLGKGEIWRRQGEDRFIETLFPFENYEPMLLNWGITYMLNQNRFTAPVFDCIEHGSEITRGKFQRLLDLIQYNHGYVVFQKLKDLKAALSTNDRALLDIPELDIEVVVTREEFENTIASQVETLNNAVDTLLNQCNIGSREVDLVIRTGGSSLIPLVRHTLSAKFGDKVVEHEPFLSVAEGLAIADYYGYEPLEPMVQS